ncbi:rho GTPase-activating protein 18 [Gastrophryne carolinensis]
MSWRPSHGVVLTAYHASSRVAGARSKESAQVSPPSHISGYAMNLGNVNPGHDKVYFNRSGSQDSLDELSLDDYWTEVENIKKTTDNTQEEHNVVVKEPDEGELEEEWLKEAGLSNLFGECSDDSQESMVFLSTLTRTQSAAVQKRIDTFTQTLRKKNKPHQIPDVRDVFKQPAVSKDKDESLNGFQPSDKNDLTQEDPIKKTIVFERVAQANKWPEDQWVLHLAPFLTSKALQAYSQMRTEDAGNYQKVKAAILRHYNIHGETFRQKFRTYRYQDREGPREAYTQLAELCTKWMAPEGKTVQQVMETIIMEQFLDVLPAPMQIWVKEHQPDDGEQAVTLAENLLLARKGLIQKPSVVRPIPFTTVTDKQRAETVKYKGQHKEITCFSCGKTGHYAKDCVMVYPKAIIPVQIDDMQVSVEMGVVPTLPYSVVLGQDIPGFGTMIKNSSLISAITTRSQVKTLSTVQPLGDVFPFDGDVFDGDLPNHEMDRLKSSSEDAPVPETDINLEISFAEQASNLKVFPAIRNEKDDDSLLPNYRLPQDKTGITKIGDLASQDMKKVTTLALIELTALYDVLGTDVKLQRAAKIKVKESGVFRVPLSVLLEQDQKKIPGTKVPLILQSLIGLIEKGGLDTEGVLRIPGASSRVKALSQELEAKFYEGTFNWDSVKQHDAASLLKLFIRELPLPLLTVEYMKAFHSVQYLPTKKHRLQALNLLIILLPDIHRDALKALLEFLQRVVDHREQNKMTLKNVAMIMAPNLFTVHNSALKNVDQDAVTSAARTASIMLFMIKYQKLLWTIPKFLVAQVRHQNVVNQKKNSKEKAMKKLLKRMAYDREKSEKMDKNLADSDIPQGYIRVQAPQFSKVSMAVQLTEDLKAGDILARFLNQESGSSNNLKREEVCLYETGGNIGERCLEDSTYMKDLSLLNPHAEWVIKLRPKE